MKKVFFILLLVMALLLVGRGAKKDQDATSKEPSRFEVVYSENPDLISSISIIRDTETGVDYLFVKSGYGAGLTPLITKGD